MARAPQDITDAELAVLQVLWDAGPLPIRRITDRLYPGGSTAQYATVQKLLERLEQKDCVKRDRSATVHVFAAGVGREELVGRRLRAVADKLCGGSWTPLLTHLVSTERLSAKERQELRRLIDELDAEPSRKERRGKERS
jgi:predicted transcriptional regulator